MKSHQMSSTKTYQSWLAMRRRCGDEKFISFRDYGARGIRVCKRWQSFENFLADMGEKPLGTSLNRKNNDGNYTPKNCVWSDRDTQNNNKRNSLKMTYQGKTQTCAQWAREIGIKYKTLRMRVVRGHSAEEAIAWA
jgi:hypothetical protein